MQRDDLKFYPKDILRHNRGIVAALLITSVIAALLEGLGLNFVIPLLEPGDGQIPFPLDYVVSLFKEIPFAARIRYIAISLVTITFFKNVFIYLNQVFSYRLELITIKYFRMLSLAHLVRLRMDYLYREKAGDLHTKIAKHTYETGVIAYILGTAITKVCTTLLLVVMLFIMSWTMTLLALVIFIGVSLGLRMLSRIAKVRGQEVVDGDKEWSRVVMDAISGMKIIRLFNRQRNFAERFEHTVDSYSERLLNLFRIKALVLPLIEVLGVFSLAGILIAGSYFVLKDQSVGLGIILAFMVISFRILSPAVAVNQAITQISAYIPYFYEVCDFLSEKGKVVLQNGTRTLPAFTSGIEYNNVLFAYTPERGTILHNISLTIPRGARVAIIGPSGSGKSTIVELLLRFYDPTFGTIRVDGIDLRELDIHSWRKKIGVVSQDTFLFNDTICANIAYANPLVNDGKLKEAARRAYAHEFIEKLPQGYDTLVGNQGVLLSGGQKQRIAIARAILPDPEILVFDEATSSLDAESEQIVQKAIEEVAQDKTVITVSHDFSVVKDADIIFVLESGRVVESGNHEKLLEKRSLYSRLAEINAMGSK